MIKRFLPALFLTISFTTLSFSAHADASPMAPGCYAEAVNQNNLKSQFQDNDPDAQLTVAREAADFVGRYTDENGRIKTDIPADVTAALAALKLKPGDTVPGGTPLGRMQEIAGRISTLTASGLDATQVTAYREQVSAALFGRDVADILDVSHLGTAAFDNILKLANLDSLQLSTLQAFNDIPMEQVQSLVSSLQNMPGKLQSLIDGSASDLMKQQMKNLGITPEYAKTLMDLYKTDPRAMLANLSETIKTKMAAVGAAGLNKMKEELSQLVGSMAIASALTDLAQQGSAYITNLLSQFPTNSTQLLSALKNLLGNMFNLNWLYGKKGNDEDSSYRDEKLEGLAKVWGPQPREPMPHKRTLQFSALKQLNKWYLLNIQMPKTAAEGTKDLVAPDLMDMVGKYAPYVGAAYRGENDLNLFRQRMNQGGDGSSRVTCSLNIAPTSGTPNPMDPAWARAEVDNCANQYILNHARFPRIVHEEAGAYRYINETMCQAMRVVPLSSEDKKDYDPAKYLGASWEKLLKDSSSLMRSGDAPTEPHYASMGTSENHGDFNLKVSKPMDVPSQFGKIEINDLIEKVPERISDPSHPFSPRWDFNDNERNKYSPLTAGYDEKGALTLSAVRCAGNATLKRIPVDILNFRLEHKWTGANFHYWIMQRIAGNYLSKRVKLPPYGETIWEVFNCSASEPCCSTAWDVKDSKLPEPLRTMICGQPKIKDLCEYMAKPLAPLNLLKLRDSRDTDIFPGYGANSVPDGYKFSTYFGNHRPYMRCWDTGNECGSDKSKPDYNTIDGAYYALMGAGREGQSCKIGGDGQIDISPIPFLTYGKADPILDWMELKLYQVNGQRTLGLNCMPRNEETFKIGQGEHFALYKGGIQVPQPDPQDASGQKTINYIWPWGWRGYVGDPVVEDRFPNFGSGGAAVTEDAGLDNAQPGDILVYDKDIVQTGGDGKWRLPYIALVDEVNNKATNPDATDENTSVTAYAINHGKFPDACGNTDRLFTGAKFTMWKKDITIRL